MKVHLPFILAHFIAYNGDFKVKKASIAIQLISESLANGNNYRQAQWTESIAVGSKSFTEAIKDKLGILAKGRKIIETGAAFQLREDIGTYIAFSDSKKGDIGAQNTYYWDITHYRGQGGQIFIVDKLQKNRKKA